MDINYFHMQPIYVIYAVGLVITHSVTTCTI